MSAEGKFFATPMEMGLRVAGTVELAGLEAPRPTTRFAFGHGHVGLICAAPTAALIASLVDGQAPAIDIAPYATDRPSIRTRAAA